MDISSEFFGLFLDKQFVLGIFTAIFTVIYAITAQKFLLKSREKRLKRQEKLWSALSQGLSSGVIRTVEDVVNIYKGIHGLGGEDISYRSGLAKNLREYLVSVVSSDALGEQEARTAKDKITAIINSIEQESPFSDLPAAERNLVIDVQKFINLGDIDSAKSKLTDLAGLAFEDTHVNLDSSQTLARLGI